ncbi:MAG: prepilin peptidase [Desulfatiglans sp.]|jgi:leader peptidase (prepilin peptidase)/N-methyltransferase|nr:prepilin peptidase [Desulfatiglans sp.]
MLPFNLQLIFAFVFGLTIGSFLNVCIYRLPLKRSIVTPPSACPSCGYRIRFYDNIPVLSYLMLWGRCRKCGTHISLIYPAVELATGLISMALLVKYNILNSNFPEFFIYLIFISALICIGFIDLEHQIIPDVISIPGIIAGLFFSLVISHIPWMDSLIGILAGGGILYLVAILFELITKKEGMGGGDVKLLAMIGAFLGWKAIPFVILVSSLTGSIIGGAALMMSKKGIRTKIPFGPFLALGAVLYVFFGKEIINWYISILSPGL